MPTTTHTPSGWTPALRAACIKRSGKLFAPCYSAKSAPCGHCRTTIALATGSN